MTVSSINHGLSVYTRADNDPGADTADNRRLRRPVDEIVSNTFNDATSGEYYDFFSGHQGIDFACGAGTDVRAMYGGVVIKVVNQWRQASPDEQFLGNHVTIRSCTDPANGAGFEHTYAHLQSKAGNLEVGDAVAKGDLIGTSGDTGTNNAGNFHLHVHLRAFGENGIVTDTYVPAKKGKVRDEQITKPYSRIDGCINFACFLPRDAKALAPAISSDSFPSGSGHRLLSPRDANAKDKYVTLFDKTQTLVKNKILVFSKPLDNYNYDTKYDRGGTATDSTGQNVEIYRAFVAGDEIACYAVVGQSPEDSADPDWYQIVHNELDNQDRLVGDTRDGWVRSRGRIVERAPDTNSAEDEGLIHDDVVRVQVEEAPTTDPEVQARPHFATPRSAAVDVRAWASLQANAAGRLAAGQCGAVLGYWDADTNVPLAERRWWLIQYRSANNRSLTGWVRDDEVWTYGDATGLPAVPTPEASVTEESVTLSWNTPAGNTVTGYGVWRGRSPESLAEVHRVKAVTTSWTDQPTTPLGTLYYYAVSVYGTGVEGFYGNPLGVITGHGTLGGTKTLVVAEKNTDIKTTANPGSTTLGYLTELSFRKTKTMRRRNRQPEYVAVEMPATRPPGAVQEGWVSASAVKVLGTDGTLAAATSNTGIRLLAPVAARSHLRLRSWVTGLHLRTGPSTDFAAYRLLTDTAVWYEVTGKTATTPVWYRLRFSDTFQGWVRGDYVELSEAAPAVAPVTPPTMPPETGPADEAGTGSGTTTGSASGDFRNLVTNPDGRWTVDKGGTTVTANFSSPRSPVQYHARQNPQPQFVLPAGFRPTAAVTRTVTGTRVNEDRTPVPNAPPAPFDLTIGTNGEMRYVNNSKVDHLGYVSYSMTGMTWQSSEALTTPARPGDTEASGVYLNQEVNRGSSWELERNGNAVSGSFGCTRSPVHHYANGSTREAQLRLPADYRPAANARFQVRGAVRVNEDGSDSTDTRKVDFWLTVQPNGEMWYDADTTLETQGVGYLRYTVNVSWTASPRITVPGVPRDLDAEDIEATELELDWRRPAEDGGAAVDGYRIQVWDADNEEWDTEESDTNSTRTSYDVESLEPYTTYRFRVAAHNSAGWGAFCSAITATTRRRAPGAPASLSATAAHDAVTLTWGTASGTVTGYTLARRTGSSRTWRRLVADTGTTARGFVDRTVSPATTYTYRVQGHNRGEAGAWSRTRNITTAAAPTIPGQVTGLAAAPGTDSHLRLTWTAPGNTGGGVTGYRVERSPDTTPRAWTVVREDTGSAAVSWDDDEVTADTAYRYRVSARNGAGIGTPSAEATGRSRPQLRLGGRLPYPLTAHTSPWTEAQATATWTAYLPERAYDLVGRVPGADGWWQVLLFGDTNPGPFWLQAAAGSAIGDTAALPQPPAAPASFTASLAGGTVTLGWTAPSAGATATGYRLWRQQDAGAWTQLGQDLDATTLTTTDSTVQNDHVYRYRLQAKSDKGLGLPAATVALAVMATPAAPDAVPSINATATSTTLQLAWTRAATGGLPVAYRVAWRLANTTDAFQETEVTGTTRTATDLTPGTAYEVRVIAFNQVGTAPATTRTATTVQVAPGLPESLNVAVTGQDATVTWQVPATGGPPNAYHLQTKTQATTDWPATHTTVTGLTRALTGLGHAVAHDLRVRAANTAGTSDWVDTTFTTGAVSQVPEAPTGLQARPGADSQMQLTWQAAATGDAAAGYRIERSADVDPRVWTEIAANTGTTAVAWSDSGLTADTTYHYRVTGRNVIGLGTPSDEATGRTRPQLSLKATTTLGLNVRSGPGTSHGRVGSIAGGSTTRYDILGKDAATAAWYQIQFSPAVTGWVHKDYVQTHGSLTGLTVTWTPPRLSLKASTTQNLNVRSGPGTSHSRVASITGGSTTRYDILGKDAATVTWYQIQFSPTVTGWVHKDYVQTHGNLGGLTVTWNPTPQLSLKASTTLGLNVRSGPGTSHSRVGSIPGGSTTRYDILGKDAATVTWYQIQFSPAVTGWVHKDYVQTHGNLTGLTVTWTPPQLSLKATTTVNLNVRSGPGTSHSRVGSITGGSTTRYDILGKDAATVTWYQIQFSPAITGWVHKDYVQTHGSLTGLTVTWTPPQLSLKASTTFGLNVRSGPGTSHSRVGTISGGSTTRYDILGKDAATPVWWQIQFSPTITGWVHGNYVQTHGNLGGVPVR